MSKSHSGLYSEELSRRLLHFFEDQAQGFDMPPARLYGLEGFIDCGLFCELIDEAAVRQQLVDLAERFFGKQAAQRYRQDDRAILHSHMPVAPVYPSTKDA